ncbi:MAG TPA: hypothetical protein VIV12_18335, partial [Streptosporangiaceae bacterium]
MIEDVQRSEVRVMRSAATVLDVIRERGRRGLPLERLYRQLFNPQLFLLAYGRIYANKGAMTPGVTPETVDGMSLAKIGAIIDALRAESYRWRPVKRVHIVRRGGALSYPQRSWEELGGSFLGLMANPKSKGGRDSSMPGKSRPWEG